MTEKNRLPIPESTQILITALVDDNEIPFEGARMPPRQIYHDEHFLRLEEESILKNDWVFVGRTGQISNAGDYFTYDIVDQPVVIFRQKDGGIRAFANTCLHRYAKLLEGSGNKQRFSCPYHAWTYTLEGDLVGAPYMGSEFSCKNKKMQLLRCEVWKGCVFVSLNEDVTSVAERYSAIEPLVANYRMDELQDLIIEDDIFECNYKLLFENFTESYHVFQIHKNSLNTSQPIDAFEVLPGGDHYSIHKIGTDPEQQDPLIDDVFNPHVTEAEQTFGWDIGLFPNGLLGVGPDHLWWLALMPEGPDRVRVRWGLSFSPYILEGVEDKNQLLEHFKTLHDQVNAEDKIGCAAVQRGSQFNASHRGYYQALEKTVWEFHRYLGKRLKKYAI